MSTPIRLIKNYPSRRLHGTANSGPIPLSARKQMGPQFIESQVTDS